MEKTVIGNWFSVIRLPITVHRLLITDDQHPLPRLAYLSHLPFQRYFALLVGIGCAAEC
jgi:hypothetical protein